MDIKERNRHIFELVYMNAMRDALLQKAFEGSKKDLMNNKKNGVRKVVQNHINDIINGKYIKKEQEDYDNDFYKLADSICEKINNNEFTFGNAQKLINMTVKYFYLLAYNDQDMTSKFKYCHCPMDKIIKDKVVLEYRNSGHKEYLKFKMYGSEKEAWSYVTWSDIEKHEPDNDVKFGIDVYKQFQNMVRYLSGKELIPIEYDYKNYYDENDLDD